MAAILILSRRRKQVDRYLAFRGNPMDLSDRAFISKFRLNKEAFLFLCDILDDDLRRKTSGYSVELQVLSVLRLFGTGSFQSVIADDHFFQMSQGTISKNLEVTCKALFRHLSNFIRFPTTDDEVKEVRKKFYQDFGFPSVTGVIDGTHIKMERPFVPDWFVYINRKGKFSINVQIVCDANMKILDIVARWPGSCHDSHIWNASSLRALMVHNRGPMTNFLIGDSGYPLEPWLLKPYAVPSSDEERLFNNKLRTLRSTIERCNGVLKGRFRCLHDTGGNLLYTPDKVCEIVICNAILHNICITRNVPLPDDVLDMEDEEEDDDEEIEEPSAPNNRRTTLLMEGAAIRNKIADFLYANA